MSVFRATRDEIRRRVVDLIARLEVESKKEKRS
jgi:hypothetical protein